MTAAFQAGWYGKIPAAGDFITRRVAGEFCQSWDRWLQGALEGARSRLGARWRDDYLSMPVWRFVLGAGLVTPSAWAGVMAPSVDSVGRCFPLVVVSELPLSGVDVVGTLFTARHWLDEMESLALSALVPSAKPATIDAAVAARPFHATAGAYERPEPMLCLRLPAAAGSRPRAAWLAEPSEVFGRTLLVCDALPPADNFCAMIDGQWVERGWVRLAAQPVS